jgi:hypothetical protein
MRYIIFLLFLSPIFAKAEVESWYFQLYGGDSLTTIEYKKIEQTRNRFKENFDVEENSSYGTFGGWAIFYTLNNSTLIGYSSQSSTGTMYGDLKSNGDDLRISFGYEISALSAIHYPWSNVGEGYFVRLDIGSARIYSDFSDEDSIWGTIFDPDDTDGIAYKFSDYGQSILIGGGRSFKVTDGSSLDLNLLQNFIRTDSSTLSFTQLALSFTW